MIDNFVSHAKTTATALGLDAALEAKCQIPAVVDFLEECLLIRADNLGALDWLANGGMDGFGSVDFCYIDPPYNTGSKFAYSDKRRTLRPGIWGRHHDWMEFMLPRLMAAKRVLSKNGLIAVSIDDNEMPRLQILMESVFGPDQFIANLVVCRSKNGKGGRANIATNHEYVCLFGASPDASVRGLEERKSDRYTKVDTHGRFAIDGLFRKKGDASLRRDRP